MASISWRRELADGKDHRADRPVRRVFELARVAIAREFALRVIRLRRGRVELMQRLQKRGLAGFIPADKGGDALQRYPPAVVDVPEILNAVANRLQHEDIVSVILAHI